MLAFRGSFQAELFGPALAAQARVIRDRSKTPNFKFTDRSGKLRRSIQVNRIAAKYAGRRYKIGRAGVYAGGQIRGGREPTLARYAHLVERGHGGPDCCQSQSVFTGSSLFDLDRTAGRFQCQCPNKICGHSEQAHCGGKSQSLGTGHHCIEQYRFHFSSKLRTFDFKTRFGCKARFQINCYIIQRTV